MAQAMAVCAMGATSAMLPGKAEALPLPCNEFCWYDCSPYAQGGCQADAQPDCLYAACVDVQDACGSSGLVHVVCYTDGIT